MNKRLLSKRIFTGSVINLRIDEVELPDGRRTSREIVEHPGAAAIVPLDGGNVRFVSQYRDAVDRQLLEIPAGKLKPGEIPRECALRELEEELGVTAGRMTHMATFYSSPGFCDEIMYMYLAEELRPGENSLDREEFVVPESRPLEPVDMLLEEIEDAKSLIGIMMAYRVVNNRREGDIVNQ
ncbi:MAG: NUDIX hydrolase [Thermoleophilia bacterium]|nr:NUDIX hydrolase [Thermoleophilia bacterium]